jgi:hypothetical protein
MLTIPEHISSTSIFSKARVAHSLACCVMIDIVGVMVNVLVSNTVDRGFEPRTMQLVFVASPLSTQH